MKTEERRESEMEIKRVAVLGAGLMGNQIAMQAAIWGYDVICYDISERMVEKAGAFSDNWFAGRVAKEKMTAETAAEIQGRLLFTPDIKKAAADADLVIEAVSDVVEIKKKALAAFDELTPERTIYASNSSYIVSSRFCDAVKDTSKVLNMHFFNPALVMKVVEVVKGPHTSQETVETAYGFVKSIGKTPVLVNKEIYGFVVNRIFSAMTKEACYLVDSGVASIEDIDTAVKGGLGHKMGPLELLDMTGIDLEYNVFMEKFRNSGDPADRPAVCLTERYAKGEYGRKSGKGFYTYENNGGEK
ncbi:3-hydroxyacyl-CoA dehydrogenase family protein [Bacilliculturomica massiliensis]|uniref:3-hydroxyacyl-CoA dehydrogenase family protein n=1 Tax=Bacilliculturomica massiliensis TaxID=1917867 RepID=UPI001FE7251F|nr:3-hydroxyacyl-CoA dehydrogenase family protein [Bacilliculturomica massiliensis]